MKADHKLAPCAVCGIEVEVHKLAPNRFVRCAEHKGQKADKAFQPELLVRSALAEVKVRNLVTCSCVMQHPEMPLTDLHSLGNGCTDPEYVCPTLDAVRRWAEPRLRRQED